MDRRLLSYNQCPFKKKQQQQQQLHGAQTAEPLFQVEVFEVLDEERVLDRLKDELDVLGVRGAGEV